MLKKLILLVITVIFLAGCGASEPRDESSAVTGSETVADTMHETTAPIQTDPTDTAEPAETAEPTEPAAASGVQPEYFVFTADSNTVTADDGTAILYENQTSAQFVSADDARSAWVYSILDQINERFETNSANLLTYAEEYLLENGTDLFYSYSNYQQLGTARHDEAVVSLIEVSSLYSGGSHPNSVQIAYNLDITNQRLLALEDVIAEGTESELARMVREDVDEKFAVIDGMNGLFGDYADTIAGSFSYGNMTPYWYFNDQGLVVFYNQYELGPYAAGIIKVELEYSELEGILLPEYIPAEQTLPGSISLISDAENTIPIIIVPDGKTLYIGAEGIVREVQISEVLWLEGTPISQNLIFSARSLSSGDVLEITGGFDDENRSFAIKFRNETGIQVLFIHDGELSAEP